MWADVHGNLHAFGFGVAVGVRQAFLQDAKDGSLNLVGKARNGLRYVKSDGDTTALRKSLDIPTNRGTEPGLIEQGRVQEVGDRPGFGETLFEQSNRFRQHFASRFGPDVPQRAPNIDFDACEILTQAVVQIAG